jgi:hypothetical protein
MLQQQMVKRRFRAKSFVARIVELKMRKRRDGHGEAVSRGSSDEEPSQQALLYRALLYCTRGGIPLNNIATASLQSAEA